MKHISSLNKAKSFIQQKSNAILLMTVLFGTSTQAALSAIIQPGVATPLASLFPQITANDPLIPYWYLAIAQSSEQFTIAGTAPQLSTYNGKTLPFYFFDQGIDPYYLGTRFTPISSGSISVSENYANSNITLPIVILQSANITPSGIGFCGYGPSGTECFTRNNVINGPVTFQVEPKNFLPQSGDEALRKYIGESSSPLLSEMNIARLALSRIINARGEPNMSTNEALRDAEYKLRNWIGGRVARGSGEDLSAEDWYYDAIFQNPLATGAYNAWKWLTDGLGIGSWNQATPGSPNSRPGGWDAAVEGFMRGIQNEPLENLYKKQESSRPNSGQTPQQPITPIANPLGSRSPVGIYVTEISDDRIFYFDPAPTSDYIYTVGVGPLVTGLVIPTQEGYNFNAVKLLLNMNHYTLFPDAVIDFTALGFPNGVSSFSILDIDWDRTSPPSAFVIGLHFANDGILALSQISIPSQVMEPNIIALILIGLGGIWLTSSQTIARLSIHAKLI